MFCTTCVPRACQAAAGGVAEAERGAKAAVGAAAAEETLRGLGGGDETWRNHFGAFCLAVRTFNFLPTHGFSTKPRKDKLLAGVQKATETWRQDDVDVLTPCWSWSNPYLVLGFQ